MPYFTLPYLILPYLAITAITKITSKQSQQSQKSHPIIVQTPYVTGKKNSLVKAIIFEQATVFENVYKLFGSVGAAFEITAIITAIVLVFLVYKRGSTFYWTLGEAIFLVLAFVSWIVFVAPMNTQFALWLTNPVPVDWMRYRDQWEYAHAVNAFIKIIGLSLLTISVLVETPKKTVIHNRC